MGTSQFLLFALQVGLAVCRGGQGPLAKKITIDVPAEPVAKVVAELSRASGIPMEAAMNLKADVVILRVHDLAVSEIQKKLAETIDATWRSENGMYRLTRTDKQTTEQETRERKYRAKQIADEIAKSKAARETAMTAESARKLVNQFVQMRDKNPNYAFQPYRDLTSAFAATPSQKAMLTLVSRLDPADLAMLQPGERIVFSDKPTRVQQKFPFDDSDVLSRFGQEQAIWNDAVSAAPAAAPGGTQVAGDPLLLHRKIAGSPDRVILMANRSNSMSSVQFRMFLTSGDDVAGYADLWLANDFIRDMSKNMLSAPRSPGAKIKFSAKTQTMMAMTKGFMTRSGAPMPDPTPDQVALLTHPENTDPLALAATDAFDSVADDRHLNLIASIPDEMVSFNFLPTITSQTLDGFLTQAQGMGDLNIEQKDGWLTVTPNRPYSARFDRIDRSALGKYLRSIVSNGRATLDAQGEYAFHSPLTDYDTFAFPMGMLLDLNSTQNVDRDWDSLKLWGSLSKDQRDTLVSGKTIPFKNLTPVQIDLVEREAYHRMMMSHVALPNWTADGMQLSMEPTEVLPNGIPPDGVLSVATKNATAILASSTVQNVRLSYARLFAPGQLGWTLATQDDPNSEFKPMFNRFQTVDRVEYTIDYLFSGEASDSATLQDVVVPADSHPVALEDLPAALRKEISDSKANAAANSGSVGVRRVPPP